MHGKVSDKIDVYAFGVVVLELLSGRKPIYSKDTKGQESLVMWVSSNMGHGIIFVSTLSEYCDCREYVRLNGMQLTYEKGSTFSIFSCPINVLLQRSCNSDSVKVYLIDLCQ